MVLLFSFLILQRLDFAFDIYSDEVSLVVSSVVVFVTAYDLYEIYHQLPLYVLYFQNRKIRVDELESMKNWND